MVKNNFSEENNLKINFENACQNYPAIMMLLNPQTGKILKVNKRAAKIYGYSIEQLEKMNIFDLNKLPEEQITKELENIKNKNRSFFHFPHLTANGELLEMEIQSYPILRDGQETILMSIIHPCKERNYLNKAAMNFIENSHDAVIALDQSMRIIKVNKKLEKYLNCQQFDLLGGKITELLKTSKPQELEIFCKHLKLGQVAEIDLEILNFNRNFNHFTILGIPTFFRDFFFGAVISFRDKSAEARKEKEKALILQKALTESEIHKKEKDDFFARLSHDMRTPLNAVIGLSELATKIENNPNETKKILEEIKESGKYLLMLVNNMLGISKTENGNFIIKPTVVNLKHFAKTITDIVSVSAKKKNIAIIEHYDPLPSPECQWLMMDDSHVKQILINLISNAIKYTPARGTVKLSYSNLGIKDEIFQGIFSIEDNGIGISENFLPHIFDKFSREDETAIDGYEGNGLGLNIVKSLIDKMGGRIEVESKKNKGSKFTVYLNFPIDPHQGKSLKLTKNNNILKNKKILLCEDIEINARITCKFLEEYGVRIDVAHNGKEGLEMFKKEKYDLILMDIRMPIMTGLEATTEIRLLNKEIPIVALSANVYAEDIQKSLAYGMNAHLSKPIDKKKLLKILRKLLKSKEPIE